MQILFNPKLRNPLIYFPILKFSTTNAASGTNGHNVLMDSVPIAFDSYCTLKSKNKIENTNPLVLIHGLFGQKQNWRSMAKAIQSKLDNFVFTVDMRNHGESPHSPFHTYQAMAADLDDFIKNEVLKKSRFKTIFLLGHSMGGKVAAEFALDPKKMAAIEKLIIVDVAPHRASNSQIFHGYIQAMKEADLNQTRSNISEELKQAIPDDKVRTFLLTNLYKPRAGPFQWRCNLDAIEANLEHILTHKVNIEQRATCRTLFISGQKSDYLLKEDRPTIKQLFPNAEFEQIADAGHWVHSEKPEQFLRSVIRFLESGYFTYQSK